MLIEVLNSRVLLLYLNWYIVTVFETASVKAIAKLPGAGNLIVSNYRVVEIEAL